MPDYSFRVKWEEPEPLSSAKKQKKHRVHKWEVIAAQLRNRPGKWALVEVKENHESATALASALRHKKLKIGPGQFETTTRDHKVYMRYVGAEKNSQPALIMEQPTSADNIPTPEFFNGSD